MNAVFEVAGILPWKGHSPGGNSRAWDRLLLRSGGKTREALPEAVADAVPEPKGSVS
jgi:hypothetical protein